MRVRDLMTTPVVTVRLTTPYKTVVEEMLVHNVTGVPVVDDAGMVLGIVTEADLLDKEAYAGPRARSLVGVLSEYLTGPGHAALRRAHGLTASSLMSEGPITVHPDDDARTAARRMLRMRVKRLPVVDGDGRLVGIVSRSDLLRLFARTDGALLAEVEGLLADPLRAPDDHEVTGEVTDGVVELLGTVKHPSDEDLLVSAVSKLDGVVMVRSWLTARESEPGVDARSPLLPPL